MKTNKEQSNILKNYKTSLIINNFYNSPKFLKVMFGNRDDDFKYKIGDINTTNNWDPTTFDSEKMSGFIFFTEDKILRWLICGDTLYQVEIPENAEVISCPSESSPNGVFRSNQIILYNPTPMTDELAMNFYLKSNLPEKSYYKSLIGCAIRGYRNTCLAIIKDKINNSNIDLALSEINDFIKTYQTDDMNTVDIGVYNEVMQILNEIKTIN